MARSSSPTVLAISEHSSPKSLAIFSYGWLGLTISCVVRLIAAAIRYGVGDSPLQRVANKDEEDPNRIDRRYELTGIDRSRMRKNCHWQEGKLHAVGASARSNAGKATSAVCDFGIRETLPCVDQNF